MKLCKECRHYRPLEAGWWIFKLRGPDQLAKCAETLEPVNGEPEKFCEFKRKPTDRCGPEGKLWAPRT